MGISICLASLRGSLASFKQSHPHSYFPGIPCPTVLGTPSRFLTTASLQSVVASYIIWYIIHHDDVHIYHQSHFRHLKSSRLTLIHTITHAWYKYLFFWLIPLNKTLPHHVFLLMTHIFNHLFSQACDTYFSCNYLLLLNCSFFIPGSVAYLLQFGKQQCFYLEIYYKNTIKENT